MPVWLLWIHQRHQPILYTSRSSDHAPVDPVGMTRQRTLTLSCPLSMTRYPYRDRVIVGLVVMAVILVIQLIQWILS